MAERGDVLQTKRRVGFVSHEGDRVVVVQATSLNATLPTVVVVPLDSNVSMYAGSPLAVRVSAVEAGTSKDAMAVASWIRVMKLDALVPGRVGRLDMTTQHELDERIRIVLDL